MVRLTDRFIFLPMSLVVLELACRVERVRTRSVDRTFSSAAARASWAFFSSLEDHKEPSASSCCWRSCHKKPVLRWRNHLLLEQRVLELLCVELDSELVRTHPGSGEQHRAFDEVRSRRPSARIRVDHQLSGWLTALSESSLTTANGSARMLSAGLVCSP